jgi:metal-responsive CopG/Arc/MetJ family transcriptional regulator
MKIKPLRSVTFKLEEELLQELDLFCMNRKVDRSVIIREAIKSYLKNASYLKNSEEG